MRPLEDGDIDPWATMLAPSLPSREGALVSERKSVIKVSVLYPNSDDCTFDMTYYCDQHMPMVKELCGDACKGIAVDQGLGGVEPGSPAAYVAIGHLLFDSLDGFQPAFGPHAARIMGDIPNYTNSTPTIQISEIKL
jgi:uncharacterized protein (TIGR02118 family)